MITALTGISGVGKTTFLKKIAKKISFKHLQASTLIKSEISLLHNEKKTSEELRNGDITDNQILLINGFKRETKGHSGLVILDAHTVIDRGEALEEIPPSVFESVGVQSLIFLQDDPVLIQKRRDANTNRERPKHTSGVLRLHQEKALCVAGKIALTLDIPLLVLSASQETILMDFLNINFLTPPDGIYNPV